MDHISHEDILVKSNTPTAKWILFVVVLLLIGASMFFFIRYQHAKKELTQLKDPAFQAEQLQQENKQLVADVANLIELPLDQEPVIGTVQDAAALAADQKFFSRAENGDRVLIYEDKAIIYRPSIHKLINVGPVYLNSTSTADISQ